MTEQAVKKKSMWRRILKYTFLILVFLLILEVVPSIFYRPMANSASLPERYIKGAYHMHSVFSDGTGTIDEISGDAGKAGLDFVILTDHGEPNRRSVSAMGWKDGVLLMGGTELSLYCGHLAAVGFTNPDYRFPPEPQEAIDEISGDLGDGKGVTFIAHPFDKKVPWTYWNVAGFTGIEVLSSYSEARKAGLLKILIFPLKYMFNSRYALLDTMSYPERNIRMWNELNAGGTHTYYGIYALDAHAKLPISRKIRFKFPTYQSMFEVMTVYIKLAAADAAGFKSMDAGTAQAVVVSSIRRGNFFNCIEAIAPGNGFDAVFMPEGSGESVSMGGASEVSEGRITVELPFQFKTLVKVFRNGEIFKVFDKIDREKLEIPIRESGVYRLEVFVPENSFDELPWIMSNPFFIGVSPNPGSSVSVSPVAVKKPLPGEGEVFRIEKNPASTGELVSVDDAESDVPVSRFSFKLARDTADTKDFWSVLGLRKAMDLSGFKGISFWARSEQKRRFWLEVRTGSGDSELWYRHSFLASPAWKRFVIPFDRFWMVFGDPDVTNSMSKPDLGAISSIFLGVNNAIAYDGAEGVLFFKEFGLF
jgi:hypothetical protein